MDVSKDFSEQLDELIKTKEATLEKGVQTEVWVKDEKSGTMKKVYVIADVVKVKQEENR